MTDTTNRICPHLDRIVLLKDAFTPDECKQIINTALNDWKEVDGTVQKENDTENTFTVDFDLRNTTVFVPQIQPDEWLLNKIFSTIINLNNQETGYQFHILGFSESPCLMRYQAADIDKHGKPGKYDWHMDIGPGSITSMRKISFSILLNPNEYEGGELCFNLRNLDEPFPNQDGIGSMIMFPSYVVHKISSMIKGTRYAIVGWVHGNSFI